MTSGEPALAHAFAQSGLMGFFRFLVNVQAESITYPLTVATVAVLASGAAISTRAAASADIPATIRIDPPKKMYSEQSTRVAAELNSVFLLIKNDYCSVFVP